MEKPTSLSCAPQSSSGYLFPKLNLNSSTKCECVNKLLLQIAHLMRKKLAYDDSQAHTWCLLFVEYILANAHCTRKDCIAHSDDMLWYVPIINVVSGNYPGTSHLQVFRRQSRNKPSVGDANINWEETVCLNVVLQQRVYPSPSRRRMDAKGECEEITYPKIYFAVDNFDQVFSDVIVSEGECVCVELVAHDRYRNKEAVLFLGSIRYDILKKVYDSRNSGTWNWAHKLMANSSKRYEFVRMKGPHGRGFSEMAVARVASCGFETPMSDSYDFRMAMETEMANQRRMSDTNVFNRLWFGSLKRGAITPGPTPTNHPLSAGGRNKRWQSDSVSVDGQRDADYDSRSINGEDFSNSKACSNSTWSMRGIGNALQFLCDKQEAVPLNTFLTNIMLPWHSILEDFVGDKMSDELIPFYIYNDVYLKRIHKVIVTVSLPKLRQMCQSVSNWEIREKLKKMLNTIEVSDVKVLESSMEQVQFVAIVNNTADCRKVSQLLNGVSFRAIGFSEPLTVSVERAKSDYPKRTDWDNYFANKRNEQVAGERPDTIYIGGLPFEWFKNSREKSYEELFKRIFSEYGEVTNVDIPQCDPLRREVNNDISGIRLSVWSFGEDTFFEAYVQFKSYSGFERAMTALVGKILVQKQANGRLYEAHLKIDFDRTGHLSERKIRLRQLKRVALKSKLKSMDEKRKEQISAVPELVSSTPLIPTTKKNIQRASTSKILSPPLSLSSGKNDQSISSSSSNEHNLSSEKYNTRQSDKSKQKLHEKKHNKKGRNYERELRKKLKHKLIERLKCIQLAREKSAKALLVHLGKMHKAELYAKVVYV